MKKLSKLTAARAPISFAMKANIAAALLAAAIVGPSQAAGPYIYVANTGEDTVSKIDVSIPAEVARYATWFTKGNATYVAPRVYSQLMDGPAPSRIARDSAGNAYVLDRFFYGFFNNGIPGNPFANDPIHLPVLLEIADTGGTPGVDTSNAGTMVLPITDGANPNHIDPGEWSDKRILWVKEIGTSGPITSGGDDGAWGRALCMDKAGNLWVGMHKSQRYYMVSAANGNMIGSVSTPGHQPYGCQVDSNGHLWSTDNANTLAEIDTNSTAPKLLNVYPDTLGAAHYGIAVSNDCSSTPPKIKVYISDQAGKSFVVFDPQASAFTYAPVPQLGVPSYAIAVDSQGNVISGGVTGRVMKIKPPGTVVWDTGVPSTPLNNLHGLIVDSNDDIWAVNCANNGQVIKHSGGSGASSLPITIGALPYTYGSGAPPTCNSTATPTPTPTPTGTPSGCAQVDGQARCLTNGEYSYTFDVSNNSGNSASQILLTPVQGSSFTLTPQLTDLSAPLQSGHSASLTTTIGNAKPGDKVCFFVSLMSEKAPCCIVQVCPTLPRCGVIETATPPPPARQQRPPPPSRRGKRRP